MIYDVTIVGAGAAGLMSAIVAARGGVRVLLLDGQPKIGAKILMSGGTRCNVTNKAVSDKDYNSKELMRVRNIIRGFDNVKAIEFFKGLGVELVMESTGKYFPKTNSGKTVLDALVAECARLKVLIKSSQKIHTISFTNDVFTLRGDGISHESKAVVLTTGGLSYPTTGSDGTGFRIAQSFGHTVIDTTPALSPLTTSDQDLKALSGIALPVTLTLFVDGRKKNAISDDFLFTHFGFSGPGPLDISRHWLAAEAKHPQIFANFIPKETPESFEAFMQGAALKTPKKTLRNLITDLLPQRLSTVLFHKAGVDGDIPLNQLGKQQRRQLSLACTHYPLAILGVVGYSKAEATAGGVDLAEVNPKTLESNNRKGLYLAGEILDVDGRIGGFNFQWAWASGHCVGQALINRKEEQ